MKHLLLAVLFFLCITTQAQFVSYEKVNKLEQIRLEENRLLNKNWRIADNIREKYNYKFQIMYGVHEEDNSMAYGFTSQEGKYVIIETLGGFLRQICVWNSTTKFQNTYKKWATKQKDFSGKLYDFGVKSFMLDGPNGDIVIYDERGDGKFLFDDEYHTDRLKIDDIKFSKKSIPTQEELESIKEICNKIFSDAINAGEKHNKELDLQLRKLAIEQEIKANRVTTKQTLASKDSLKKAEEKKVKKINIIKNSY